MSAFHDRLCEATGLPRVIFNGTVEILEIQMAHAMPWIGDLPEDKRNQMIEFCFRLGS